MSHVSPDGVFTGLAAVPAALVSASAEVRVLAFALAVRDEYTWGAGASRSNPWFRAGEVLPAGVPWPPMHADQRGIPPEILEALAALTARGFLDVKPGGDGVPPRWCLIDEPAARLVVRAALAGGGAL